MRLSLLQPRLPQIPARGVQMLRVSVTDRCNFRCVYCMPAEGVAWLPKEKLLTFEQIADVVRAGVDRRITHVKLTGGEPTLRHGLTDLVAMLRRIPGVDDLSMTTNGFNLPSLARPLRESGLDRVTVSIDSLHPDRFKSITRGGDVSAVLAGVETALNAGFDAVKINCVAMRGINDDEFADFAALTIDRPVTVRFIEYMPLGDSAVSRAVEGPQSAVGGRRQDVSPPTADRRLPTVSPDELGPAAGCGGQLRGDVFIAETDIRGRIEAALGELTPIDRRTETGVGPANVYRLASRDAAGRVGFISAMSAPFCATCNRLRLTATGVLRSCLFDGGEVDLAPLLAASDVSERREVVADAMIRCASLRPNTHASRGDEAMSRVGG